VKGVLLNVLVMMIKLDRRPALSDNKDRLIFLLPAWRKDWWIVKSLVVCANGSRFGKALRFAPFMIALAGIGGTALADERMVIIPTDNQPFTAEKSDIVRLTGKGIAGSKIEATVKGPAKVEATSIVRQLTNGQPLLGGMVKEFDLKLTDTGKVTVTITVTPPQPGAKPKVTRIQFDVK